MAVISIAPPALPGAFDYFAIRLIWSKTLSNMMCVKVCITATKLSSKTIDVSRSFIRFAFRSQPQHFPSCQDRFPIPMVVFEDADPLFFPVCGATFQPPHFLTMCVSRLVAMVILAFLAFHLFGIRFSVALIEGFYLFGILLAPLAVILPLLPFTIFFDLALGLPVSLWVSQTYSPTTISSQASRRARSSALTY